MPTENGQQHHVGSGANINDPTQNFIERVAAISRTMRRRQINIGQTTMSCSEGGDEVTGTFMSGKDAQHSSMHSTMKSDPELLQTLVALLQKKSLALQQDQS